MAVEKLPVVHGIRLRMPVSELVKLPVVEKPSRTPVGARDFESEKRVETKGGKDRPLFYLRTFDEKVFALVVYDETISANIDDFVLRLTNTLNLPLSSWYKHSNSQIISCQEFEITVNPTPNYLTLLDLPGSKTVLRAAEAEIQKRWKP
ncbi:MAG: hypothetical protein IPG22_10720 [Acidobacteria bacterium]|nr:hypothetical protein [Acidobacteriota bacterium]